MSRQTAPNRDADLGQAIRAVPWTFLSYAATKAVSIVATIVLARLLSPADFGTVTTAGLILHWCSMLRDLGLGGAIVLRQDLDRRGMGTALSLLLAAGLAVTVVVGGTAPLAARLFDDARLADVLLALSVTAILGAPGLFYLSLLQREMRFRERFVADMVQTVAYVTVAVGAAALGAGVWSLVAGQLVAVAAFSASVLVVTPIRVRPAFVRETARSLLATGRRFMIQGGLSQVEQDADYFAVGVMLSPASLGWYAMSYRLAEVPYRAIGDPVATVTFPTFARRHEKGLDVAAPFVAALRGVALLTVPLGVVLSAAAEPFTLAILGDAWRPMIEPLAVLGILAGLRAIHVTQGWLLNSVGEAGLMARIAAITVVPLVPALVVAAGLGGITAVAWVMLADVLARVLMLAVAIARRAGVALSRQWVAVRASLLAGAGAWVAGRACVAGLDGADPFVELLLASATALGAYALLVRLVDPDAPRFVTRQIGRLWPTRGR